MAGLNLFALDLQGRAESGTVVELEHPGDGTPLIDPATKKVVTITLRGKDSPRVVAVTNKQHDAAQDRLRKRKSFRTAEQLRKDTVEVLVAATITWEGIGDESGEVLPFSPENARELYSSEGAAWIIEQLNAALEDRERFFTKESKD